MKRSKLTPDELLFQYIEDREIGGANLTIDQIDEIESLLDSDAQFQHQAEDITKHLRILRDAQHPPIPDNLASRCLESIRMRQEPIASPMRWKWAYAGTLAVALVFISGIWIGRHSSPTQNTFQQLTEIQSILILRLESSLAYRYQEKIDSEENPWYTPMMNVKLTSQAITAAHQEHSGDPVIERGLSLAVAQNIKVLQSLCEYIESNRDIADRDFQFINTSGDLIEKAI